MQTGGFFITGGAGRRIFAELLPGALHMNDAELLKRITINPKIFGGKPIVRGRRLAVEHVLGMLAAGDSVDDLLHAYAWLERDDVLACLAYARRVVGHERVEPAITSGAA